MGSDTIDCNDGDLCNGTETCTPAIGECVAGVPVCESGTLCEGCCQCGRLSLS